MRVKQNASSLRMVKKKTTLSRIMEYKSVYLMMLPAIIGFAIFNYAPLYGIQLAFKEYWVMEGIAGSPWVGFENFIEIFQLEKFWEVMGNTLIISFEKLIFGFPMPIILALLLNEVYHNKFKKTIQTVVYLPHFVSWVIMYGVIYALLGSTGVVNSFFVNIGEEKINFLSNPDYFRPMVIISQIWKNAGWKSIIYLAALAGIDPSLYESATVDGANRWKKMWHITLPSILPTISTLLILDCGKLMTAGFDQILNLYNEAVYEVGDIVETYVYRIGVTKGQYESATAVNLFLNVINLFILVAVNKISKKVSGTGLY
ncbi:ABC transporter permease [Vallitalea okinawensis]|uniref:ABC transporter permease n=1 Tax=Vallitalea okinawensis TaxID=2078660 RepID=UPI001FA86A99|nr:ABC transporter permease subunit [Vallitalea okinawensis]